MKKFSFMLLCVAAFALVACDKKNEEPKPDPTPEPEPQEWVSPISIEDGTIADWDALNANYVAVANCAANCSSYQGLKMVKVYSDDYYINVLAEINSDEIADRAWVPFHFYIDVDNSATTGGFGDQWIDASVDFLTEGAVFAEDAACSYNPAGFTWSGEVGGTGWEWAETTLAEGGNAAASQYVKVGDKEYFEIKMMREMLPTAPLAFGATYKIGFDIQQDWNSVGILPNANDDEATGSKVLANMLTVTTEFTDK